MNGASSPVGTPKAIGLVPNAPRAPPYGVVLPLPVWPQPTVTMPMQPARAACSAYSPNRPMCPVRTKLAQQTAAPRALSMASAMARRAV